MKRIIFFCFVLSIGLALLDSCGTVSPGYLNKSADLELRKKEAKVKQEENNTDYQKGVQDADVERKRNENTFLRSTQSTEVAHGNWKLGVDQKSFDILAASQSATDTSAMKVGVIKNNDFWKAAKFEFINAGFTRTFDLMPAGEKAKTAAPKELTVELPKGFYTVNVYLKEYLGWTKKYTAPLTVNDLANSFYEGDGENYYFVVIY